MSEKVTTCTFTSAGDHFPFSFQNNTNIFRVRIKVPTGEGTPFLAERFCSKLFLALKNVSRGVDIGAI